MPIPYKGETLSQYMDRCVSMLIKVEGKTREQAVGQCLGMWRYYRNKKKPAKPKKST